MSEIRTIKPADGRRVRFPDTGRVLPPEGETVAWGSYWHRRLVAGDVVVVDEPAPAEGPAPAAAAALGAGTTTAPDQGVAPAAKGAAPAPAPQPALGAAATAAPDPAATAAVKDA